MVKIPEALFKCDSSSSLNDVDTVIIMHWRRGGSTST